MDNNVKSDNIPIVYLIGTGMGAIDSYTVEAVQAIKSSQILIGAKRMTDSAMDLLKNIEKTYNAVIDDNVIKDTNEDNNYKIIDNYNKHIFISYMPDEIKNILDANTFSQAAVLLSGDSGFYSGAKKITSVLEAYDVRIIAGISSVSYFCSRIGKSWDDMHITSCHGRHSNLIQRIYKNKKTFALLDGQEAIHNLCEKLIYYNMQHVHLYIGERLSYEDEKILSGSPDELKDIVTGSLVVVFAENDNAVNRIAYNIPDDAFIRGKVPMTKSSIRSVCISNMELKDDSIVYDIGAGTGSVSVEIAMQSPDIQVYAIEKNAAAIELINLNKQKFAADNIEIINAYAPEGMDTLPKPDCVFIGGSTGNIISIIDTVFAKNPQCTIIINTVTLNTITELMNMLESDNGYKADITQISATHSYEAGRYMLMKADNPVYIVKIKKDI